MQEKPALSNREISTAENVTTVLIAWASLISWVGLYIAAIVLMPQVVRLMIPTFSIQPWVTEVKNLYTGIPLLSLIVLSFFGKESRRIAGVSLMSWILLLILLGLLGYMQGALMSPLDRAISASEKPLQIRHVNITP